MEIFKQEKNILVLGAGSNLVLPEFFEGLVISANLKGINAVFDDEDSVILSVAAGEDWADLIEYTLEHQCYGLENLTLIPGKVGASPIQNIGAYGVEAGQFIESVDVFDFETGEFANLSKAQCCFAYRDSVFKQQAGRYLILSVEFRLSKSPDFNLDYQSIRDYMNEHNLDASALSHRQVSDMVKAIRLQRLPNPEETPNVGSFFKNPEVGINQFESLQASFPGLSGHSIQASDNQVATMKLSAAQLIEACGFKGESLGAVGVSDLHSLVLVNKGEASQQDVLMMANKIKQGVSERFGVSLEIEPVIPVI